jgi:hypothetical protein
MRKFILIAGFVLASATAHGADRSLSLGRIETQSAPAPAKAVDASKTAEAPQAATPKYTERPAIVEPKAETSKAETPKVETQRAERSRPVAKIDQSAIARAKAERGRPVMRSTASVGRMARPRLTRHSIKARIIYALHRYGIYW